MKQLDNDNDNTFFEPYPSIVINDKDYIKNVLDTMINIQAIVAYHFFNKRNLGICDLTSYTIPLTNNTNNEIEILASFFKQIIVHKRKIDGIPVLIQLNYVNDLVYEVFDEMIAKKNVDKCLSHFYIERNFKKENLYQAFYEIEKHETINTKNEYFDYLINTSTSSMMSIGSMFIDINGFSLDEIENDEYVQQFASRVKHLYLWIYKIERPEISYYTKELRWYL